MPSLVRDVTFDLQNENGRCGKVPGVECQNRRGSAYSSLELRVHLVLLHARKWPVSQAEDGWSEVGEVGRGRSWRMLKTLASTFVLNGGAWPAGSS